MRFISLVTFLCLSLSVHASPIFLGMPFMYGQHWKANLSDSDFHNGTQIDFNMYGSGGPGCTGAGRDNDSGQPVLAAHSGKVVTSELQTGFANMIEIESNYDSEYSTIYAHFDNPSPLNVGDKVEIGQFIGRVGNSGWSDYSHLHFELRKNGISVGIDSIEGQAVSDNACLESVTPEFKRLAGVYRFWSGDKKCHFYTANIEERNITIRELDQVWDYEGDSFTALSAQSSDSEPVYRFWNNQTGCHFYTIHPAEKIATDNNPDWEYEGIAYYAFPNSNAASTTPLYRFYSSVYESHFYTASLAERDHVMSNDSNWTYEGIAYWVHLGNYNNNSSFERVRLGASGTKPVHCGSMSQKECNAQITTTILTNNQ